MNNSNSKTNKSDEQKFIDLYHEIVNLCNKNTWGDPMSYARAKEIYAAGALRHTVSNTLSGADAYNQNGQPVEYKSTTGGKIQGSYTGISKMNTWEEQVEYLMEDKIGKYPEHYFNGFNKDGILEESWKLSGQDVYQILLPKVKKSFDTFGKRKDPRLSGNVTQSEIYKFGVKVI